MSVRLIHITPELPPTVGGIADYTAILSRRLVEVSDEAVEPVLVRAGKASGELPEVDFEYVDHGGTYSSEDLCTTIEKLVNEASGPAVVLLQYSGYGYAPRGAPLWLFRALQRACGEEGLPLVTMFHELYATGSPWTSAFWLSPVQRYVAAQLARLSSAVVTNRTESAAWLRRYVPAEAPVRVQPVFSNVGEPEHVPPWDEREPYAVIFGGQSKKKRLYDALRTAESRNLLRDAGIRRVVDIGTSDETLEEVQGCPITYQGIQPASSVSECLQHARIGLSHYPTSFLTKSGIWSSYAAHGVPTVVFSKKHSTEMLENRTHYLRAEDNTIYCNKNILHQVGEKAWEWYKANAHSQQAARKICDQLPI